MNSISTADRTKIRICNKCSTEFHVRSTYYRHIKKCQGEKSESQNKVHNYLCREEDCHFTSKLSLDLINHLQNFHKIEVPLHNQNFQKYSEFKLWKDNFERDTKSSFIFRSSRNNHNGRVEYFYCNRSGYYESVSNGKRAQKSQGLNKIGFNCPASIKVTVEDPDKISATICPFHYGHDNNLSHLSMPKGDQETIAKQLISGIPHHHILRNIFDGEVEKLERKHLCTKQDIINISKKYGTEHVQKHPNDHMSVKLYVEENLQEKKNILLFKQQGEDNLYFPADINNPLEKNDFALGIMTDFQKSMFQQFGNNIVCTDATHGTNYYDFNLITVLIIDEYREGIPVAWLISNKENSLVLRLFFEIIKRELGSISPKLFMSDNAPQYYNSWVQVFGGEVKKLICHWHVHHDWQKQLNKIKDKVTAKTVYKGLCLLLDESSKDKFEILLNKCVKDLEDNPDTQVFGEYFKKEWVGNAEQWAKCYRLNCTINTNMFLESFHKILKYEDGYFKRKQGRRVDKCMYILLQFSKDLAMKRLIKLEKGKNNKKIAELNKRHRSALRLPLDLITKTSDCTWAVKSQKSIEAETTASDNLIYKVTKQHTCEYGCKVKCLQCNICLHSYTCSCPDGLTSSTICKHIHLAVISQKHDPAEQRNFSDLEMKVSCENNFKNSVPQSDNETTEYFGESDLCLKSVNPVHKEDLESIKENLKKKHALLLEKIECCNDRDLLLAARKHINNANNILDLHSTKSKLIQQEISRPVIANNKNTEKQYRFFSTKKQRRNKSVKYAKPTFEEKNDLENSILGHYSLENRDDHTYSISHSSNSVNPQSTVKPDMNTSKITKAAVKFLEKFASSEIVQSIIGNKNKIEETQIEVAPEKVPDSVIDTKSDILQVARDYVTSDAWLIISSVIDFKKKAWSCALCAVITTKENMICCDFCGKWFHWKCQQLKKEPIQKEWYCNECSRQESQKL